MYITAVPIILAGIMDNLFTKTRFHHRHIYPIDGYRRFRGKRIFGNNKTWCGFFAMIVFCTISQVIVGALYDYFGISYLSDFYNIYANTVLYNLVIGFIIGFLYVLFELPNSFLKRQFDIESGMTERSVKGFFFFICDQIDSLIAVMFVIYSVSGISVYKYFGYVFLGGITHLALNVVMSFLHLRRSI